MKRVVVTGMAALTPIGSDWTTIAARLEERRSGIRTMREWEIYDGLSSRLAAPIDDFEKPEHYTRKAVRSMGRVSLLATRATELALIDAGLLGDPLLQSGQVRRCIRFVVRQPAGASASSARCC